LAEPVIAWLRLGIWIDADAHVEDAADLAWPSAASAAASIRHRAAGISPVGMEPSEGIQLSASPAVTASAHGPKAPSHTGIGPPGLGFMSRSRTLWWRPCWV
jgi:hypothetical protein